MTPFYPMRLTPDPRDPRFGGFALSEFTDEARALRRDDVSTDEGRPVMSMLTKKEITPSPDWLEEESPDSEHWDRRYWSTHCEGFRVDFPGGAHGYVEEVRHRADPDRAALLTVRVGMLGRRVVIVPVDEIAYLVPRAEHIWLKSPLEIERTEASSSAAHR